MIGAILGDFVGSQFDFRPIKTKDFEWIGPRSHFSDDSVMTIAVAGALVEALQGQEPDTPVDYPLVAARARACMRTLGRAYPQAGYGSSFAIWLNQDTETGYGSCGNGACMRVSPCGLVARSLDEARQLAYAVTVVSHDHIEGLRGAQATAEAVYLARAHLPLEEIKAYFEATYCDLSFTLDEIRPNFTFDSSSQGTAPYALRAFYESSSYEDAIRTVMSLGGDSDTLGATVGGMAAAYYGVPQEWRELILKGLDERLRTIIAAAEALCLARASSAPSTAAESMHSAVDPKLATFEQSLHLDPELVRVEMQQALQNAPQLRYTVPPPGLEQLKRQEWMMHSAR